MAAFGENKKEKATDFKVNVTKTFQSLLKKNKTAETSQSWSQLVKVAGFRGYLTTFSHSG